MSGQVGDPKGRVIDPYEFTLAFGQEFHARHEVQRTFVRVEHRGKVLEPLAPQVALRGGVGTHDLGFRCDLVKCPVFHGDLHGVERFRLPYGAWLAPTLLPRGPQGQRHQARHDETKGRRSAAGRAARAAATSSASARVALTSRSHSHRQLARWFTAIAVLTDQARTLHGWAASVAFAGFRCNRIPNV